MHTAQTDHRLLRRPDNQLPPQPGSADVARGLTEMTPFHRDAASSTNQKLTARDLAVIVIDNLPPGVVETESGTPGAVAYGHDLLAKLEPALALWPDDLNGLEAKGVALWLQGRTEEAATTFDSVLARAAAKAAPNAAEREVTLSRAGTLAMLSKRYDAAIAYWERATKANPWRMSYQLSLARAYMRKNDWHGAVAAAQRALQLNPNSIDTRVVLISCFLGMGDAIKARVEFELLMEFHPPGEKELRDWFQRRSAGQQP